MLWLAARGHRVLGVELAQLAVEQFFAEHGLVADDPESKYGTHYRAGEIELICGDAFALDAEALADCAGVFDRAALIALPPELRQRYATRPYACLPSGCRGLLITLEYPAQEKAGPPFTVPEHEVRALYGRGLDDRRAGSQRHPRRPARIHRRGRDRAGHGGLPPAASLSGYPSATTGDTPRGCMLVTWLQAPRTCCCWCCCSSPLVSGWWLLRGSLPKLDGELAAPRPVRTGHDPARRAAAWSPSSGQRGRCDARTRLRARAGTLFRDGPDAPHRRPASWRSCSARSR